MSKKFKFKIKDNDVSVNVSDEELSKAKKLKEIDNLLSEFQTISGSISEKMKKWDKQVKDLKK